MTMTTIRNFNDCEIDFDAAVNLMDNRLREELHDAVAGTDTTEQEFYDMYCEAHRKRFGKGFEVN
jgi:hypothetical protein